MFLIVDTLEAIGLVFGSFLAAGIMCWLASEVAIRLHHRSWTSLLMLLVLSMLFLSGLTHSGFVRLSAVYGLFGVAFLWLSTRNDNPRSGPFEGGDK